jgi:hypothetical protein
VFASAVADARKKEFHCPRCVFQVEVDIINPTSNSEQYFQKFDEYVRQAKLHMGYYLRLDTEVFFFIASQRHSNPTSPKRPPDNLAVISVPEQEHENN